MLKIFFTILTISFYPNWVQAEKEVTVSPYIEAEMTLFDVDSTNDQFADINNDKNTESFNGELLNQKLLEMYAHKNYHEIPLVAVHAFVLNLREAVNNDDRELVVKIANCSKEKPCAWTTRRISSDEVSLRQITSSRDFIKNYDLIITESIKKALNDKKLLETLRGRYLWVATFWDDIWFSPKEGVHAFNCIED